MPTGVNRVPRPEEWILRKTCTVCGVSKPWARFSPARYWDDGSVRSVRSRCIECHVKACREARAGWREANREHVREYERQWRKKRRLQASSERSSNGGGRLPAEPLHVFLWERVMGMENPSWDDLAVQAGVPDRSIRRVLGQKHVSARLADEVVTRLGGRLYDVYPKLEEVA